MSEEIRDAHIDFAQALVQLARDHDVTHFDGKFRLGFDLRAPGGVWSNPDVKISWSEGRHGDDSNIGLWYEKHAGIPEIAPNSAMIPPHTYASEGNFYEVGSRKGKGTKFWERWRHRILDFPQSREEAFERMTPDTRAWMEKKWP